MRGVVFSRRAERDLRLVGDRGTIERIRDALTAVAGGDPSLDIKPLVGAEPWLRLRVGDHRIIYRVVDPAESDDARWLVARVVHRRDLERAVSTLT